MIKTPRLIDAKNIAVVTFCLLGCVAAHAQFQMPPTAPPVITGNNNPMLPPTAPPVITGNNNYSTDALRATLIFQLEQLQNGDFSNQQAEVQTTYADLKPEYLSTFTWIGFVKNLIPGNLTPDQALTATNLLTSYATLMDAVSNACHEETLGDKAHDSAAMYLGAAAGRLNDPNADLSPVSLLLYQAQQSISEATDQYNSAIKNYNTCIADMNILITNIWLFLNSLNEVSA